jgi:hypothetical protein
MIAAYKKAKGTFKAGLRDMQTTGWKRHGLTLAVLSTLLFSPVLGLGYFGFLLVLKWMCVSSIASPLPIEKLAEDSFDWDDDDYHHPFPTYGQVSRHSRDDD